MLECEIIVSRWSLVVSQRLTTNGQRRRTAASRDSEETF
jgi:hypothetical protein